MKPFHWRCLSLSIALLPACFSYQAPRGTNLQPKADVSLRFASPRTVTVTPWSRKEPDRTCQAKHVTGTVTSVTGDTITLKSLKYPLDVATDDQPCMRGRAARFERRKDDQITERRFSGSRTGGLFAGIALFVGFAAYGASQL